MNPGDAASHSVWSSEIYFNASEIGRVEVTQYGRIRVQIDNFDMSFLPDGDIIPVMHEIFSDGTLDKYSKEDRWKLWNAIQIKYANAVAVCKKYQESKPRSTGMNKDEMIRSQAERWMKEHGY